MLINQNPVFEITEVIRERREERSFKTKKRSINVISCRIDGSAEFVFGDKVIKIGRGDVLYIPKRTEYSQKTSGETIIAVHIRPYSHITQEVEYAAIRNKEQVISRFEEIYSEWSKKMPGYRQRALGLLYQLLGDVKSDLAMDVNNPYSRILGSITYMKSHFNIPTLQISDIAEKSNISEIYFRKLWGQCYDITPAQYIVKLRMNFAKSLLSGSDYTVSEIAEKCGFSDSKYFSTKFKQMNGVTPSDYRKSRF